MKTNKRLFQANTVELCDRAKEHHWIPFPVSLVCEEQTIIQGGPLFLPPPNFPMCQNGEKQQSPELATPSNDRVQSLPPPKIGRVHNFGEFRGGKFWILPFSEGDKFWTLSFEGVPSSRL